MKHSGAQVGQIRQRSALASSAVLVPEILVPGEPRRRTKRARGHSLRDVILVDLIETAASCSRGVVDSVGEHSRINFRCGFNGANQKSISDSEVVQGKRNFLHTRLTERQYLLIIGVGVFNFFFFFLHDKNEMT